MILSLNKTNRFDSVYINSETIVELFTRPKPRKEYPCLINGSKCRHKFIYISYQRESMITISLWFRHLQQLVDSIEPIIYMIPINLEFLPQYSTYFRKTIDVLNNQIQFFFTLKQFCNFNGIVIMTFTRPTKSQFLCTFSLKLKKNESLNEIMHRKFF